MKTLYVDYESEAHVIEDTLGEDGPYTGYHHERIDLRVLGLCKDTEYPFDEELKVDDFLYGQDHGYLVTVRFTTGSTFGCTEGYYKFIAAFVEQKDAIQVAKEIRDNHENVSGHKTFHPTISNPNYDEYGILPEWKGYFSRLEGIDVERVCVSDGSAKLRF